MLPHGKAGFLFEPEEGVNDTQGLDISLVVEQVTFGGKGLARLPNGKVCFIPRVIPGETVAVHIQKERASYAEGTLERIIEASPDRQKAPCRVFGRCGGCQYQHMTYERQLQMKQEQVADVLRRIGGVTEPPVEATLASPRPFHYRNRVTVHAKDGRIGFYGERSRQIVGVSECPIASEAVNIQLADLLKSRPRDGEYPLREPGEFRGFRQVNDAMTGPLLDLVADLAAPGGHLLVDAYCGAGFFAKRLRDLFKLTIGIEWSTDAIRSAREDVRDGEIYLLGDVKRHILPALTSAPAEETTLLLDPPSEGLDPEVLAVIGERQPSRIIYVSCNPSTLARDIKKLGPGYRLSRARPVDMFPQTAEIEVAILLELH